MKRTTYPKKKKTFHTMFVSSAKEKTLKKVSFSHRRTEDVEIYFVANRSTNATSASCTFRVAGKAPELWNAVTGERRIPSCKAGEGSTLISLDFDPCGSWFVVFRKATANPAKYANGKPELKTLAEMDGAWVASFDTNWGGPT